MHGSFWRGPAQGRLPRSPGVQDGRMQFSMNECQVLRHPRQSPDPLRAHGHDPLPGARQFNPYGQCPAQGTFAVAASSVAAVGAPPLTATAVLSQLMGHVPFMAPLVLTSLCHCCFSGPRCWNGLPGLAWPQRAGTLSEVKVPCSDPGRGLHS